MQGRRWWWHLSRLHIWGGSFHTTAFLSKCSEWDLVGAAGEMGSSPSSLCLLSPHGIDVSQVFLTETESPLIFPDIAQNYFF